MGQFSFRKCSWLLALALTGCDTVYTATVPCKFCGSDVPQDVTGDPACSESDAKASAETICVLREGTVAGDATVEQELVIGGECSGSSSPGPVPRLSPAAARMVNQLVRTARKPNAANTNQPAVGCAFAHDAKCDCTTFSGVITLTAYPKCGESCDPYYEGLETRCRTDYGGTASNFRCVNTGIPCELSKPTAPLTPIPDPMFAASQP